VVETLADDLLEEGADPGLDLLEGRPGAWDTNLLLMVDQFEDQEVTIDVRAAVETADPDSRPIMRTFDIRPLFDPPARGEDKLDQLLRWLDEQDLSPDSWLF